MVSVTDVTDREQVKELVALTEDELGPVDILVNCAGVMYFTLMKNLREDEWEQTVDVICKGMLNCVGAVLDGMLNRGRGHIITISSDAGRKVFPGLAAYSGGKFFVEAVSQGLRLETAGTGLKVTTVQPGNVATGLLRMSGDEEALEEYGMPTGAKNAGPRGRGGFGRSRVETAGARRRKRGPGRAPRRARVAGSRQVRRQEIPAFRAPPARS